MLGRILILLTASLSLACTAEEVLREHVQDKFLSAHNRHRIANSLPLVDWSFNLSAKANTDARRLSGHCWINSLGNGENANVHQIWSLREQTPSIAVKKWMDEPDTRYAILNKTTQFIGCGYVACKDPWSYATSVIYVCRYGEEDEEITSISLGNGLRPGRGRQLQPKTPYGD